MTAPEDSIAPAPGAGFTVEVMGSAIAIDLSPTVSVDVAEELHHQWQAALTERAPAARVWCSADPAEPLPGDATAFARSADVEELAGLLCDSVIGVATTELVPVEHRHEQLSQLPDLVGVRAGAVVVDGRAVLLAGRSRLDDELQALAGFADHLADRAVAVRIGDGQVIGAPTPVVRLAGGISRGRRVAAPGALGLRTVTGPVPLGAIAIIDHTEGESGWEPVPVPVAVAQLTPLVPVLPALPHPVQELARLVGLAGGGIAIRYRDAAELPGLLAEVLAHDLEQPLTIPAEPGPGDTRAPQLGDVRRATLVDGISDGATLALCRQDRKVIALAGLGPLLWDAAREWISVDDLLDQVVAAVEAPGQEDEVRMAADAALDALVAQEVLTRLE